MSKNVKTEKAAKKANAKVEKVERDAFGARTGTEAAKVNAALTRKPLTVREVTESAGLERPDKYNVRNHLKKLVAKGFAVEKDHTFALKADKPAKKAKAA